MKIGSYLSGAIIAVGGLIGALIVAGNSPLIYVDVLSLLVIVILALPLLIGTYGWKDYWTSWRLAFRPKMAGKGDYLQAAEVLKNTRRLVYLAAGLATFVGVIGTLMYIDGKPELASRTVNFAVSMIAVFYALIIDLALISPVRGYLLRESIEVDPK